MPFVVENLSLETIAALEPLVARIKRRDKALADQLVRAASSVALNIAESNYSDPGNQRARLFSAAGSANEVRAALKVAVAWGYCSAAQVRAPSAALDRVIAMLWKLTHR
jgi:four helix bundle protein